MNKIENEEKHAETVRLYEVEELSIKRIAMRLQITRQAVTYRLKKAGVQFRPIRHESLKTLDRDVLVRLYVDDRLPVDAVAKRLKVGSNIVIRELERYSIERRPMNIENRRSTVLDILKIGRSATIPFKSPQFVTLYQMATVRGIKIRVKRIDPDHVRVTRVSNDLKGWYPSPLDRLKVGDAAIIKIESANGSYSYLYDRAKTKGMKLSIHRLDEQTVKVTRTK